MDSLELLGKLDELSMIRRKIISSLDLGALHSSLGSTQINVLMALLKTPESNMTALSQQVGLEKSSLTRSIDSLIDAGLVTRSNSPRDRRIINCALTAKGIRAAEKIDRLMALHCDELFSNLTDAAKSELCGHLEAAIGLLSGSRCGTEPADPGEASPAGASPKRGRVPG